MNIKIIVATHKKYQMPTDSVYLPIHAGHLNKPDLGYIGDDTGDNISERNWFYSEASAIYWAWKNLNADVIGIAHYRRHFTLKNRLFSSTHGKWACVLSREETEQLMATNDIVVAGKRWYLVDSNRSHYSNGHNPKELDLIQQIISERCPDYLEAFEKMLNRRWAHMFNMFIMKRDKVDEFCIWWFDLLFEFEKRIDMTGYPPQEKRAFIEEILLDVWLIKKQYPYREVRVMYMEHQNWIKKLFLVFWRKFVTHKNIY